MAAGPLTVNVHEAKTHLSRLLEHVARGRSVIIAKAGQPVARLTSVDAPASPRRLGFLDGQIDVPDDFDEMGADDIARAFGARR